MRVLAIIATIALVHVHASHPPSTAIQHINAKQVRSLQKFGKFCEQHKVPAPWMKYMQAPQFRHLQDTQDEDEPQIPEACKQACPGADAAMAGLTTDIVAASQPYKASLESLEEKGDDQTPAETKAMMDKMIPFYRDVMTVAFNDLCKSRAAYECMVTNMATCYPVDPNVEESAAMNPMTIAKDFGGDIGCMCDVCSNSQAAFVEMTVSMMSYMFDAFMAIADAIASGMTASQNAGAAEPSEELKTKLLQAMCPMVPVMRCFNANSNECSNMMSAGLALSGAQIFDGTANGATDGTTDGTDGADGTDGSTDFTKMAETAKQCKDAGISIAPPASESVVRQKVTLKNLDFAKVMANPALKAEIIAKVQAAYLAKLAGYLAEDIGVTLTRGSVVANVKITPMHGSSGENVQAAISEGGDDATAEAVLASVKITSGLEAVLEEGETMETLSAEADAPVESNEKKALAAGSFKAGVLGTM